MKLLVYVFRRPNMFLVHENMFNLTGYGELKNMFTIENYQSNHEKLTLYYPERFLNIVEQQKLISRIESAGYKEVMISTTSVYIVQTVHNTNIRVVQDELHDDDFKISNDESGMPYDGGLGIIGGTINGV